MEGSSSSKLVEQEQRCAENICSAIEDSDLQRVVYLGGLSPGSGNKSAHLKSRLLVEEALLSTGRECVALRASIVVGAGSRSFKLLVQLLEKLPLLPLPSWSQNATCPVDGRDLLQILVKAAEESDLKTHSLDVAGPEKVTYAELLDRIRKAMVIHRPQLNLRLSLTPVVSRLAAALTGEDPGLITPLMESLSSSLLPRKSHLASEFFNLEPRPLDAAVEHALGVLESTAKASKVMSN